MLKHINTILMDNWDNNFPELKKPKIIDYLSVAGSAEGLTTTFLAFNRESSKPLFVTKIYRERDENYYGTSETEILLKLSQCKSLISNSVPSIIFEKYLFGHKVLIQSIVDGKPMNIVMSSNGIPDLKHSKTNFELCKLILQDLYFNSIDNSLTVISSQEKQLMKLVSNFENTFKLTLQEKKRLKKIHENISIISEYGCCIQHGDFCRQNILKSDVGGLYKLNIIDWSDSVSNGTPLHDLFYFLTSYFMQQRVNDGIQSINSAFNDTFIKPSEYYELVKNTIFEFCENLSIRKKHISLLFGLFLIKQSLFEYKKMKRCINKDTLPRFVLKLAYNNNANIDNAGKQQMWINFFKICVKNNIFNDSKFLNN